MNLKDYIKRKSPDREEPKTPEEAILTYQGMSEEGLLQEMRRVAEKNRQEGTLSNSDLEAFYQNAQSMLTPEQSAKMRTLIEELKR